MPWDPRMDGPVPQRPVLLLLSVVPVWPVEDGFALRASALLRELAVRWDVVLAAPDADRLPRTFVEVLRECASLPRTGRWPHLPAQHDLASLERPVQALVLAWRPRAVLLLCGAEYLADALPPSLPTVADHVDCLTLATLETLRARRGLRARASAAMDAWRMARFERRLARRMTRTILAGARDAMAMRALGAARPSLIPNGVRAAPETCWASRDPVPTAAFTGVLDYPPNTDAALHAALELWPQVRRDVPAARLLLVGRRPPPAMRALTEESGVEVLADVSDVGDALRRAWLALAPMRRGSGVKNKVLEAWGRGRAVVLTPRAVNGLALPPGHEQLVARAPATFARLTATLLGDPAHLATLGATALAFARTSCTWHAMGERVHRELLRAMHAAS